MRPQILEKVLTVSGVMTAHDSMHHVDTAPRPDGFSLPVLGFAIADAVQVVYLPRIRRLISLLSMRSSGGRREVNPPGMKMTMVFALLLRSAMKSLSWWHLKSSNTEMLGRCLMMLPLLGRSFQVSEIQWVHYRASHQLFSCTPNYMTPAACPNLVRFTGISAAMEPFRG